MRSKHWRGFSRGGTQGLGIHSQLMILVRACAPDVAELWLLLEITHGAKPQRVSRKGLGEPTWVAPAAPVACANDKNSWPRAAPALPTDHSLKARPDLEESLRVTCSVYSCVMERVSPALHCTELLFVLPSRQL